MAIFLRRRWEPGPGAPARYSTEQERDYDAYLPDPLCGRDIRLSPALVAEVNEVDALIRDFASSAPTSPHLESLARFLLRSEAVASSRIEGVVANARAVAHLELMLSTPSSASTTSHRFSDGAREVVNNVLALREAVTSAATRPELAVQDVSSLQAALMVGTDHAEFAGTLRTVQSWVGGHAYGPHGAEFVPPPAEYVDELMNDLAAFMTLEHPLPLVQAALVHAQFETIHPYTDGNGRTGRALIHTMLARRGLAVGRVLPISLSLLAHPREYITGLTAYRYDGTPDSTAAFAGTESWIRVFLAATRDAVAEAQRFTGELSQMRADWDERLAAYRVSQRKRPSPRKGSAVLRLMEQLPGVPIVTARAVEALLDVSFVAASAALEELHGAGILDLAEASRGTRAFLSTSVLDLINGAELRLSYTNWDLASAQRAET